VAFAPFDIFAAIPASLRAALACSWHALRVNDSGAGAGVSSGHQPHCSSKPRVKALDAPASDPLLEVVIDRFVRREVVWKHAPLAAGFQQVKQSVHDLTRRMLFVGTLIGEYRLG
jgi:hypothetical protein